MISTVSQLDAERGSRPSGPAGRATIPTSGCVACVSVPELLE
jgi:hypothetical protein